MRDLVDVLLTHFRENLPQTQVIIGLESRGFLIGPLISYHLNIPFVPIRKAGIVLESVFIDELIFIYTPGKLPGDVKKMKYQLEYGSDVFEVQTESINEGARCVLVDDLLATGGSLKTAADLIKECKGVVLGAVVIIELDDLKGREKVKPLSVHSITHF